MHHALPRRRRRPARWQTDYPNAFHRPLLHHHHHHRETTTARLKLPGLPELLQTRHSDALQTYRLHSRAILPAHRPAKPAGASMAPGYGCSRRMGRPIPE